jgi:hypothetical protein
MKKLEDVVKQVLVENKNKPSPLKEIYEFTAKRTVSTKDIKVTKESILEKYKKLF